MTQASRPQADSLASYPAPSDPGPYSGDQWAELFRVLFTGDQQATQGPLVRYLNELAVTDNAATEVYVATGAGMVNGHFLVSSELETWTVPAGPAGGRIDRVVMVENNTNAEVTQSTAARPLLFPADLSEYTATPGIPPYSARLAILRGDDLGALPGLDTTTALYMVELARYGINNVPTISAQVDYREFCYFSSTIGTRQFFVPALAGYNDTDSTEITMNSVGSSITHLMWGPALILPDSKLSYGGGRFLVPADYASDMTSKAVIGSTISANIYGDNRYYAGECSEGHDTHSDATGYAATAIVGAAIMQNCIQSLSVSSIGTSDIVQLVYYRDATDVLDTIDNIVYLLGWIIEYQAES